MTWMGFIFSWALGILLVLSCIGFVLAVRELYFITKYDDTLTIEKKLFIFMVCLPVINIATTCLVIFHALITAAKERKEGRTMYIKKM